MLLINRIIENGETLAVNGFPPAPGEGCIALATEDAVQKNAELAFGDQGGTPLLHEGPNGFSVNQFQSAVFMASGERQPGREGLVLFPVLGFLVALELPSHLLTQEIWKLGNVVIGE